jgi:protein-tyrosine phosphatase
MEAGESDLKANVVGVNILKYLLPCIEFINLSVGKSQSILVHCDSGVCLAPAVILAYLIKEKGMTLLNAVNLLVHEKAYLNVAINTSIW